MKRLRVVVVLLVVWTLSCLSGCKNQDSAAVSPADRACRVTVSGAVSGTFASCTAVINHYPAGYAAIGGRQGWVFTLVLPPSSAKGDIKDVGINFELPGAPTKGTFTLANAVQQGATSAHVHGPADELFDEVKSVTLTIEDIKLVYEQVIDGEKIRSFTLNGKLDMQLATRAGKSVAVSASF